MNVRGDRSANVRGQASPSPSQSPLKRESTILFNKHKLNVKLKEYTQSVIAQVSRRVTIQNMGGDPFELVDTVQSAVETAERCSIVPEEEKQIDSFHTSL
jgi:hypothetical protein